MKDGYNTVHRALARGNYLEVASSQKRHSSEKAEPRKHFAEAHLPSVEPLDPVQHV